MAHCRANSGVVQRRTLEAIRHFAHLVNNIHHPRQSMHLRLRHVVNMLKALQSLSRRKELTAQNLPPTFPGMLKLGCVMQCFPSCDHSHFLCPVAIVGGKRLFYTRAVNREHQQIRRVFCLDRLLSTITSCLAICPFISLPPSPNPPIRILTH